MSKWPATVAPLHFWKAEWIDYRLVPDCEGLVGGWRWYTPTKASRGIVGIEVAITVTEMASAKFGLPAARKQNAYRAVLAAVIGDVA